MNAAINAVRVKVARVAAVVGLLAGCGPARGLCDDRTDFFENRIRPLFERACIECHSGDDASGGLRLTDRRGWKDAGVIEPGRPQASRLLEVLRSEDPDEVMPPPDSGHEVSSQEIGFVERWIADGAIDPRAGEGDAGHVGPKLRSRIFEITDEDRSYWAFQPLTEPAFSAAEEASSAAAKIDLLVSRGFGSRMGLAMNPPATPRQLVRRATYGLWGLPPSPEDVAKFEHDPGDVAWKALVDRLLASHRYGERWGGYWLDWVRYAETNGYERDGDKPNAWRYRDYVIRAFATDKPYDRFLLEQLAGDELAASEGWSSEVEPDRWRDAIIATGFCRLHQWDDEPDSSEQAELDDADDVLVTTSTVFLGLTVGCARCHNHKYDPISQRDYYSMLGFFRGLDPYGQPKLGGGSRGTGKISRNLLFSDGSADVLAAVELPAPKPTFVLHRGDRASPRESVDPAAPTLLREIHGEQPTIVPLGDSSGRRMTLARWLVGPGHPLVARVMVNRIWQRHFGLGIVDTPDDFGRTGSSPSNLPLLDFLAREFVASGWSIHHMHRIILASNAYRMSSRADNAVALEVDPESRLFWRQRVRRLDAEAIRDSVLFVSGRLDAKASGPAVFPTLSPEVLERANAAARRWPETPAGEQNCRSVYLAVKRTLPIPFLEVMDRSIGSSPVIVRPSTTTAPQALLLMNDPWVHDQASRLRDRVQEEAGPAPSAMVERLWQLVYQRSATEQERAAAIAYLEEQTRLQEEPRADDQPSSAAWRSLVRAVLNSNEAIYID